MYTYKVKEILKVYDGDTITVLIDLGFYTYQVQKLRLARIDAPEIRGEEREKGLVVRDLLRDILYAAEEVIVTTKKDRKGKYGRYIAEVWADGININDWLLEEGLVELYRE